MCLPVKQIQEQKKDYIKIFTKINTEGIHIVLLIMIKVSYIQKWLNVKPPSVEE